MFDFFFCDPLDDKIVYSVNIKFGTKFIVASCDVFWKIARTG
jgi:hypothetical protein